jgi:hypothetical protein
VTRQADWQYRLPARVGTTIARRQCGCSEEARAIAWKAQVRLCARFRRLQARRMLKTKAVVAIARELSGFMWAIACQQAANRQTPSTRSATRRRSRWRTLDSVTKAIHRHLRP